MINFIVTKLALKILSWKENATIILRTWRRSFGCEKVGRKANYQTQLKRIECCLRKIISSLILN